MIDLRDPKKFNRRTVRSIYDLPKAEGVNVRVEMAQRVSLFSRLGWKLCSKREGLGKHSGDSFVIIELDMTKGLSSTLYAVSKFVLHFQGSTKVRLYYISNDNNRVVTCESIRIWWVPRQWHGKDFAGWVMSVAWLIHFQDDQRIGINAQVSINMYIV